MRGPAGRVNWLAELMVELGVSHFPARFPGRVLRRHEPVEPEADERELAAIVPFHTKVRVELLGYCCGRMLDALHHHVHRFAGSAVEPLCSHPSRIGVNTTFGAS
jgi:hypothetical protein